MKKIFNNIFRAVKNHNKFYTIGVLFFLYITNIVGNLQGDIALFAFFIGFFGALLWSVWVSENPNEKEKKLVEKITNFMENIGNK